MAENKKSFVMYADYKEQFDALSDVDAGQLIKHIFKYVNDENPTSDNEKVTLMFISIKQQLKRDLSKWDVTKEQKKISGQLGNLKRWHADLYELHINENMTLEKALEIAESRKLSHTDKVPSQNIANIAVNDNVNVNDINNNKPANADIVINEKVNWQGLIDQFNEITGKKCKVVNDKTKRQIKDRFKEGYTKEHISTAIYNCSIDEFHIKNALKYLTLEFITRPEKLERYSTVK